MADIDTIFKSKLSENEKRAKSIFGKLLLLLRKNNCMKMYSLMSGVSEQKYSDNVITLVFSDNSSYLLLNNKEDIADLNKYLNEIEEGLRVELQESGEKTFDEHQFEEYLKKEFGSIVTIK